MSKAPEGRPSTDRRAVRQAVQDRRRLLRYLVRTAGLMASLPALRQCRTPTSPDDAMAVAVQRVRVGRPTASRTSPGPSLRTRTSRCDWFRVIHMMLTSKKGISALQIQRVMGFGSYKTA